MQVAVHWIGRDLAFLSWQGERYGGSAPERGCSGIVTLRASSRGELLGHGGFAKVSVLTVVKRTCALTSCPQGLYGLEQLRAPGSSTVAVFTSGGEATSVRSSGACMTRVAWTT